MKALIKKDIMLIVKNFSYINLIAVAFPMIVVIQQPNFFMYVASIAISLILASQVMTTMALDEKANWIKILSALPISTKTEVISKYLLAVIMSCVTISIIFPISLIFGHFSDVNTGSLLAYAAIGFTVGLAYNLLIIPAAYKFGTIKCRSIFMIFVIVPTLFIHLLNMIGIQFDIDASTALSPILILLGVMFVVGIIMLSFCSAYKARAKKR